MADADFPVVSRIHEVLQRDEIPVWGAQSYTKFRIVEVKIILLLHEVLRRDNIHVRIDENLVKWRIIEMECVLLELYSDQNVAGSEDQRRR